jgi:hypothetical protein
MNGITFIRGQGGLGRRLPGEDHISGLIVRQETARPILELRSVADAEQAGVTAGANPEVHYYVSEFFRMAPGAKLFLMIPAFSVSLPVAIKQLQQHAAGAIRQVAIADEAIAAEFTEGELPPIGAALDELASDNMPLSVIVQLYFASNQLAGLPDLHSVMSLPRVSVCIAADGGGYGKWVTANGDIPSARAGGAATLLGTVARSRVSDSVGWVERYNVVSTAYDKSLTGGVQQGREFDVIALMDGTPLSSLTPAQVQTLGDKGYIFLLKHVGVAGSYWNDGYTATALDSDYAYIEGNRTIDKACRGVYRALLPSLSGPAYLDPDSGNLSQDTVTAFEELGNTALDQMVRDGELSGGRTVIDPAQDILGTSSLAITIDLVPVGVLRHIVVTIGFKLKLD